MRSRKTSNRKVARRRLRVVFTALSICFSPITALAQSAPSAADTNVCRVVDAAGNPIHEAHIRSFPLKWATIADAKGEFHWPLAQLKSGALGGLLVSAPGYISRQLSITTLGKGYVVDQPDGTVIMHRTCRVEGIVLGPDGHPLAGAPLALDAAEHYGVEFNTTPSFAHTFTDDVGHFVFDNAPPGEVLIHYPFNGECLSKSEVAARKWDRWVKITGGIPTPIVPVKDVVAVAHLTLNNGESRSNLVLDLSKSTEVVEGRVVGEHGPLKGAAVVLAFPLRMIVKESTASGTDTMTSGVDSMVSDSAASTDAQGRYRIEHVPRGDWQVRADFKTSQPVSVSVTTSAPLNEAPDITLATK